MRRQKSTSEIETSRLQQLEGALEKEDRKYTLKFLEHFQTHKDKKNNSNSLEIKKYSKFSNFLTFYFKFYVHIVYILVYAIYQLNRYIKILNSI